MLRARLSNGDFLFGVDAENVHRLQAGMPIVIDLKPMGGTDKLIITYAATLEALMAELQAQGIALPPPQPWPGTSDPH